MPPPPAPAAAPNAPPSGAPPAWAQALLLVGATAAAYANGLDASYHFDDHAVILGGAAARDLAALWPPRGARWLVDLTFALGHRLHGLDVRGFHLVNVAIHAANALLVAALARAVLATPALRGAAAGPLLRGWLPLLAGAVFALHPLATQAVTYLAQRYTSLATLLFLASLLLWLRGRLALDEGRRGRAAALVALAAAAAAGAMRSKEIALPLPAVALAAEVLLLRGPPRRLLLLLPLAAAALLVPLAHLRPDGDGGTALALAETEAIPRGTYLLTQVRVVATYLRLLVLPLGQHLDWDVRLSTSPWEPAVLGAALVLAGVAGGAAALLRWSRRSGRAEGTLAFLGAGWFLATVALESSVVPIRDVLVEHRTYLPGAGFALAAATGLLAVAGRAARAGRAGPIGWALLLAVAAPLGAATWARNEVWRDDLSLWGESARRSPRKARPHNELGIALMERGRPEEAIAEFKAAAGLQLGYPEALLNLADAYRVTGRLAEAERVYLQLLAIAPTLWQAHNNLGGTYEAMGRREEALQRYREALRLAPGRPEPAANVARLLGLGRRGARP